MNETEILGKCEELGISTEILKQERKPPRPMSRNEAKEWTRRVALSHLKSRIEKAETLISRVMNASNGLNRKQTAFVMAQLAQKAHIVNTRDFEKGVLPIITAELKARKEKEKEKIESQKQHREKRQTEPFRLYEAFYSAKYGGYTKELDHYRKMSFKEITTLFNKAEQWTPNRQSHAKIKSELLQWLRDQIMKKQPASENPQDPKGAIQKVIQIFRGH